jgi:hypothetical protein
MKNVFVKTHIFRGQERTAECLSNLTNPEIAPDVYINSFCYLCYRVINNDIKQDSREAVESLLFKNFKKAQSKLDELACDAARARWCSSLVMAYCYMYAQLIGFDEHIFDIVFSFVKKDTTRFWKSSIVNTLMCRLACVAYMIKKEKYTEANELITDSDKVYKKTLVDFDTSTFFDTAFEISDAAKLYFCIMLFGSISGYPLIYNIDKKFVKFLRGQLDPLENYYKLLCSIMPELQVKENDPEGTEFIQKYILKDDLSSGGQRKINAARLPTDFNPKEYRKYNPDLKDYTDQAAALHYLNFGIGEKRVYKVNLPEYFDAEHYGCLNKDISSLSKEQLEAHYEAYGRLEGRKYFDSLFDLDFFIKYNHLPQSASYSTYVKDIRKIKSAKVLAAVEALSGKDKGAVLLVNHLSTFNGATQYLATLYAELKSDKNIGKIYFVDFEQNADLRNKYRIAEEDYISYEQDSTILYYICTKTKPRKIYFNSINANYADVIKWLDSALVLWHSHEVKKHFEYLSGEYAPTHVVSARIQSEYTVNVPKIQKEVLTKNELAVIDFLKSEKAEPVRNNLNVLDTAKVTIGMCGSLCDRKNHKTFVALAKVYPDYNFLWIGGERSILDDAVPNFYQIQYTANPYKYFTILDYFLLTSQIDPCPYVVLENLYLGNCVIAFKDNIYTDHKCALLENVYFEYPGGLNITTACAALDKFVQPATKPIKNTAGAEYVAKKFSEFDEELLTLLK